MLNKGSLVQKQGSLALLILNLITTWVRQNRKASIVLEYYHNGGTITFK